MSPKNTLLTVGLTAVGLLGLAATRAADPGDPPATPGPPSATAPTTSPTVLLKSNGQLLRGVITEDKEFYEVRQSGGPIRVRKSEAEGVFESTAAAYTYRRSLVPEGDPDERLKLARWCLTQHMPAEAKVELQAVLALSPKAREARAMLTSILASEARASARPRVDEGVVQTRAEVVEGPAAVASPGGAPAEMDANVLRGARRALGVSALPVIFDLPPAIAVKRADHFARYVQPVLQAACARCHNEHHETEFRLIEVKKRRDMTADVFRANLDATLRLVDADNPARSVLLSSALLPHGNGPNKRPIFRGSNDPRFQILSAWVNSLRPTPSPGRPADGVVPARYAGHDGPAPGGSVFGADRDQTAGGTSVTPATLGNPVEPYKKFPGTEVVPAQRFVPGRGMVTEKGPPPPGEFPIPPLLGGPLPKPKAAAPGPAASPARKPGTPAAPGSAKAQAPAPLARPLKGPPPDDPAAGPPTSAKPVKIDPALLEKALMNRNQPPQ